jgi:hypothetical protein
MASHTSKPADTDANPLDGVTFDLNGETFTCYGRVSMFRMAETARRLAATQAAGENIGMAMAAESMHEALGAAEYARFVDYFIAGGIGDDVIMAIIQDINDQAQANVEATTGRPTVPSSGSSSGEPAPEGQPARTIKLGTRGISLVTSDGDSPSDLAAQVAAARGTATAKPAARKRAGRAAAAG